MARQPGLWPVVEHRGSGTHQSARTWAVEKTLLWFESDLQGHSVLVQTDNSTVVAYLNREGGTRSPTLCCHTMRLLSWCRDHQITLRAIHIAGVTNILADDLSRGRTSDPTEISLAPQIAQTIFVRFCHPAIDLFASYQNKQLPVYCSRTRDPRAYAADALSVDWKGLTAYAFPPISLLPKVVEKVARDDCYVLLIAPFWPKHVWFRPMVDLLVGRPMLLPPLQDLLRQGVHGEFLPNEHLRLTVWPLSGNDARRKAFLEGLQAWSPRVDANQRSRLTLSVWLPTMSGVLREISLPLEQM